MLVPLRGNDRIEDVLPHIERLAHAGMKVVFVVHYGLIGFRELMDQLLAIDKELGFTGVSKTCDPERGTLTSSASQRIRRSLKALMDRGIEIDIILYGCRLEARLEKYQGRSDVEVFTPDSGSNDCVVHGLKKSTPCSSLPSEKRLSASLRTEIFASPGQTNKPFLLR